MVSEYIPFDTDWPHQTYAAVETCRWINEGYTRFCVTSPTGGGKGRYVQRICEHGANDGLTTIVVSNRRLLTDQLLKNLHKNGVNVGSRAADFESWTNPDALVQVVSSQTEASRVFNARRKRGDEVELHRGDIVILDEAHINKGDSTVEMINEYHTKYGAVIIGLTATPLGIGHIYRDGLIVAGNNSHLRDCGALVWANRFEPCVMDLPKIRKSKTGVFSQGEVESEARSIWSQHIIANVFQSWKELNPDSRPSIGMAPGVPESLGLATEFWKRGINAAHIDAEGIFVNGEYKRTTEQSDRDELFAMVKDGTVKQVWNRFVLREGVDIPELYLLQLATPIADLKGYLQICGRVLRAHPSKTVARVVDHAGCIRMHGSPNNDRDEDWKQYFFEDESKITKDRHERLTSPTNNEPEPITCPECGAMRDKGTKCPKCGFEHQKSVRKVIQESGKLRAVTGDAYQKRKVKQEPNTEKLWLQTYYRMKNARTPKTFSQAVALFKREHGYYPPETLPMMPKDRLDFHRKINHVDRADLYQKGN